MIAGHNVSVYEQHFSNDKNDIATCTAMAGKNLE